MLSTVREGSVWLEAVRATGDKGEPGEERSSRPFQGFGFYSEQNGDPWERMKERQNPKLT